MAAAAGAARASAATVWPVMPQVKTTPPAQSSPNFGNASCSGSSQTAGKRKAGASTTGRVARSHVAPGPSNRCSTVPARGTAAMVPSMHSPVTDAGSFISQNDRAAAVVRSTATKAATPSAACIGPSVRHNEEGFTSIEDWTSRRAVRLGRCAAARIIGWSIGRRQSIFRPM